MIRFTLEETRPADKVNIRGDGPINLDSARHARERHKGWYLYWRATLNLLCFGAMGL